MLSMIQVKVRLFGTFRRFSDGSQIVLQLPDPSSLLELRSAFEKALCLIDPHFQENQLIQESAFATETAVLSETSRIEHDCSVSILPPVCGG